MRGAVTCAINRGELGNQVGTMFFFRSKGELQSAWAATVDFTGEGIYLPTVIQGMRLDAGGRAVLGWVNIIVRGVSP